MNRITRRRSPKWGSSKGKPNPFESRGLDKFQEVYSELERMRSNIAEQEGVSTSDVWFTRGTSSSKKWIPVVVGKSRSSSTSSRLEKKSSIPHWEVDNDDTNQVPDALQTTFVAGESQSQSSVSSSSSWLAIKSEQMVYDMQQGARKALKTITLFIMVVAAVADVLIALIAGFTSSWIARHLRPLWARYLPLAFSKQQSKDLSFASPVALSSLNTTPTTSPPSYSCVSAPTSPRYHQQSQVESPRQQHQQQHQSLRGSSKDPRGGSCFSTPVSPVRGGSGCTYFSSDRPGLSSGSSPTRFQRFEMVQKKQHQQQQQDESDPSSGDESGLTPVMCIVLVILVGLSFGRVTAAVMATGAWFLFPVVDKLRSGQGLKRGSSL